MKVCVDCKLEKSLSEFSVAKQNRDGYRGQCKECVRRKEATYRTEHADSVKSKRREWTIKQRPNRIQCVKRWRKEHPEKHRAHKRVAKALLSGRLVKPSQCEVCCQTVLLHAHHDDYSKPLDVRWVCRPCHNTIHGKVLRKAS